MIAATSDRIAPASTDDAACAPAQRLLHGAAFALLLCVVAARPFLGEVTFPVCPYPVGGAQAFAETEGAVPPTDRGQMARVTFAMALLAAGALWLLGGAIGGRLQVRHRLLAAGVGAFAVLSVISALWADDMRAALTGWLEQASLLLACWLAAELCSGVEGRRRFAALAVLLAGLAATLAAKGLYQLAVEIPDNVAMLQEMRAKGLVLPGGAPGSPGARMFQTRAGEMTPTGYFGLANVLASGLLILLAAGAGLAVDKLVAALGSFKKWRASRRKGEIHTPMLAAVISLVLVVPVAAVLVLTRSRGAIVAAAAVGAGLAAALAFRRTLVAHWRKAALACGLAVAAGLGGMAAYGLARDRLPTRTMRFRWYYWTASAQIVAERPVFGVGPGNFPAAYLRQRRAAAEEEVKSPHNFIAHALTQYGLAGGLCYVVLAVAVVVGAARPRDDAPPDDAESKRAGGVWILAAVVLSAVLCRVYFAGLAASPIAVLWDAILPGLVFGVFLLAALWTGGRLRDGLSLPGKGVRIALACGLAAFVLHNIVTFSLWMPAAGLLFWATAGAALAWGRGGRPRIVQALRWPVAVAGVLAVAAAGLFFWLPVARRTALTDEALERWVRGESGEAIRLAGLAVEADPLDAAPAVDAAKLTLWSVRRGGDAAIRADLVPGADWARTAAQRDPTDAAAWRLLGQIEWYTFAPDSLRYVRRERAQPSESVLAQLRERLADRPGDTRLLSDLACVEYSRGRYDEAMRLWWEAIGSDRAPALYSHLGDASWRAGQTDGAREAWRKAVRPYAGAEPSWFRTYPKAVKLNPMNHRLRVEYADRLRFAGAWALPECLKQIDEAQRINAALDADSVHRFSQAELDEIATIRACVAALAQTQSRPFAPR